MRIQLILSSRNWSRSRCGAHEAMTLGHFTQPAAYHYARCSGGSARRVRIGLWLCEMNLNEYLSQRPNKQYPGNLPDTRADYQCYSLFSGGLLRDHRARAFSSGLFCFTLVHSHHATFVVGSECIDIIFLLIQFQFWYFKN